MPIALAFIGGVIAAELFDGCTSRALDNVKKSNAEFEKLRENEDWLNHYVMEYLASLQMQGIVTINSEYPDITPQQQVVYPQQAAPVHQYTVQQA